MNKKLLFIAAISALLCGCGNTNTSTSTQEEKNPVLRFLLASDVHLTNSESYNDQRLKKAFEMAYEYSESQEYNKLDAALFAGDIANTGSAIQFERFFRIANQAKKDETKLITTLGNHELDFAEDKSIDPIELYTSYSNTSEDTHDIINGYHFISICPTDGKGFNEDKISWLENELKIANDDTPDKPIFVMEHHPILNTVYGSFGDPSGISDLKETIFKYHNVVNMTGHSHFSIMDPRSLYQGEITAINTGSISYPDNAINELRHYGVFPVDQYGRYRFSGTDFLPGSEAQIVEVFDDGAMDVIGLDVYNDRQLFVRHVVSTVDKSKFITNEMKKAEYKIFEWDNDAEAELFSYDDETLEIMIPQIETELDEIIESYRAIVKLNGEEHVRGYALSNYKLVDRPDSIIISMSEIDVPSGDYDVDIYAVNPYNVISTRPIHYSFSL